MLNLVTNGIESMGKTGSCEVICLDRPFEQDLSYGAVFIQIKNDIGQKGSKPAGYGLGLEIVQELVKNAGGRTRIYSQASRFVVEIEIPEFSYSKMPRVQERA
jgi:two-component sensor histidine kinase